MKKRNLEFRKNYPLVSIVMPVYNAGDFLVPAIESILSQTYKNFEFIIIDDSSSDGSWEIIQKYKKAYPKRIKAIRTEKNLNRGGDTCANIGINKAKGKYIARMDADDIAYPTRLQKQVNFLGKNKNVILVGTQAKVISKTGEIIGEKSEPCNCDLIKKAYFTYHPIIHPSMMIRSKIKNKKFRYTIKYSSNNDYLTFFKLLVSGNRFVNLKEPLLYYRIHPKNDTFSHLKQSFFNTLKIRYQIIKENHYLPTFSQIVVNILQVFVISFLPERLLTNIYLVVKGIIKPQIKVRPFFSTIKNTCFSGYRRFAYFLSTL